MFRKSNINMLFYIVTIKDTKIIIQNKQKYNNNKARRLRKKASASNHRLKVKIIWNKSTFDNNPPRLLKSSVGHFEFDQVYFFMVYLYLKLHIWFYSIGLAIWSGFPDNTHIKKMMADNRPFWPPWPSFCPNFAQFRTHPSY